MVIPAYNCENTIIKCIDSVFNQTCIDLIKEVIVIDDGSIDKTAVLVMEKYGERVILVRKRNGGVASARNEGIKIAQGSWIALLDSDDVWLPEKIEKQWRYIIQYNEIRFIGCNKNNERVHIGRKVDDGLFKLNLTSILIKHWPHTSTALIDKRVFDEVGLYNENMRYAEDGDMWNRIVIKYPIYYVAETYEIAGNFKKQYGETGLSANITMMHSGDMRNLKLLLEKGNISRFAYYAFYLYKKIKYIIRVCQASRHIDNYGKRN